MITRTEIERELKFAKDPDNQLEIIADLNGLSVSDVQKILSGENPADRKIKKRTRCRKNHKWTSEDVEKVRQLRESGMLLSGIAKIMGESEAAIQGICMRYEIRYRKDNR